MIQYFWVKKMGKNDIKIWRINLRTDLEMKEQLTLFDECKKDGIIGVGWPVKDLEILNLNQEDYEKSITKENFEEIPNFNSFKASMNALREMKKDDLIWTRKNNHYYLCKVKSNEKVDILSETENEDKWIYHYVNCHFCEIGTEEKVLGAIAKRFNRGVIARLRSDNEKEENMIKDFSQYMYDKVSGEKYYGVTMSSYGIEDIWTINDPLEVEELVGLFMQMKLEYGIYTSTNKKSEKEYEYVLFKRSNPVQKALLQVKTTDLSDIDMTAYQFLKGQPFFFFSTGKIDTSLIEKDGVIVETVDSFLKNEKQMSECRIMIHIQKKDIEDFLMTHGNNQLLPVKFEWLKIKGDMTNENL